MARKTRTSKRRKTKPSSGKAKQQNASDLKLSEVAALELRISDDVKRNVKRWLWLPVSILLIIGGFFGVTTYTGVKRLQTKLIAQAKEDLKKQVVDLYDEKNVARVVDDVIKQDANDLIRRKVEMEIDPVVRDIKKQQQEHSQVLADFRKDQEKYAMITLFHDLAFKAENGDVQAYRKLADVANFQDSELSQTAVQTIRRIYEMYFEQSSMIYRHYTDDVPDSKVIKGLYDKNFLIRKRAVCTVRKRQMYGQIQALIERIPVEPNLDVLASIQHTLNGLLGVKLKILDVGALTKYAEVWEHKKDELLDSKAVDK